MSTCESGGTFPESGSQPAKRSLVEELNLRYSAWQDAGPMWRQVDEIRRHHARFQAFRLAIFSGLVAVAQAQESLEADVIPDDAEIMGAERQWQSPMAAVEYRPAIDNSFGTEADRLVLSGMTGRLAERVAYDFGFVPESLAWRQLVIRMPGFRAEQAGEQQHLEVCGSLLPAPGKSGVIQATGELPADCMAVARLLDRYDVFQVQ